MTDGGFRPMHPGQPESTEAGCSCSRHQPDAPWRYAAHPDCPIHGLHMIRAMLEASPDNDRPRYEP